MSSISAPKISSKFEVQCDNPEVLARYQSDPGVRPYISRAIDERHLKLKSKATPKRLQSLLRDLGFLVELAEE